jgi:HlyD family secretion protein
MRQKISAMLTATQRTKYQDMVANAPARGAANANAVAKPEVAKEAAKSPVDAANSVAARAVAEGALALKPSKSVAIAAAPGAAAAAQAATPAAPAAPSAGAPAAPSAGAGGGAAGGQGGGPLAEFRNRLVTDLQLSPDQIAKVDAIYAEARPKFGALRDLAPEERTKARERITADTRAKIGDILTAEQKPKYAALQADAGSRTATRGRIYLLGANGKPVAYNVRLGITDGTSTELQVGPNSPNADVLKEGALVVIGTSTVGSAAAGANGAGGAARPSGPRMPF